MNKIKAAILNSSIAEYVRNKSKHIILPGFEGVPLYDVVMFFTRQMSKVGINDRAAAISFNFLMAYMPISTQITIELLDLVKMFSPDENTYGVIATFLNDFLNTPRSGLLSFGFVVAVFYASNAVMALMRSFNRSLLSYKQRGFVNERWTAIKLTTVLIVMLIVTISLLVTQGALFQWLMETLEIQNMILRQLIFSVRWIIIILLILGSIGYVYKYAPAITKRWKLASPGAIFATFLVVLSTFAFSYYVNNFGSYNKVYGSIGTIMILMFLIYLNSLILLIGYELNVCIHSLKAVAEERK
jgi:membrane protein